MGTTALSAMQMMDTSHGGNTTFPSQQINAFGGQPVPYSVGDARSGGGYQPSTMNMINDM